MTRSARALLESLIDYAGMFPPAALPLPEALANYQRYRDGEYGWILGKFVVPVAVCHPERSEGPGGEGGTLLTASRPPGSLATLGMTVISSGDVAADLRANSWIDTIEIRASTENEINRAADAIGEDVAVYVEIRDFTLLDAIARRNLRAKIRCGGDVVPTVSEVARFIAACVERRLPFKATAGLHHPVRSENQHGFLNVFLAAALPQVAENVLADDDPRAFTFTDEAAWWRGREVTVAEIEEMRQNAVSFGSCSFEEPIDDMKELGWL